MKALHFWNFTPGDRGPASQDDATDAPSLINNFQSTTPLPLMSEATCGGAQRNHISVAVGDCTESQKPLKSKGLSRRQIPLQSRESPVRVNHTSVQKSNAKTARRHINTKLDSINKYHCTTATPPVA